MRKLTPAEEGILALKQEVSPEEYQINQIVDELKKLVSSCVEDRRHLHYQDLFEFVRDCLKFIEDNTHIFIEKR